jgi:hypothetical protein
MQAVRPSQTYFSYSANLPHPFLAASPFAALRTQSGHGMAMEFSHFLSDLSIEYERKIMRRWERLRSHFLIILR